MTVMRKTTLISKSAFAREMKLAPSRITQLVADGLPVSPDGKIDARQGKRWIATNLDAHRRQARKPGTETTSATRSEKLRWESQLRELEFRKRSGELIDRAATERVIFERASLERDKWLGWIPRAAQQLAAETDADPTKIFGILDRIVRDHLTQLAATPLKVLRDG